MFEWVIFGLVVGLVAKIVMPRRDSGGVINLVLLGMSGGVMGGVIGHAAGWYQESDPAGFGMAVFGAMLFLWGYRLSIGRWRARAWSREVSSKPSTLTHAHQGFDQGYTPR
jgi:uncharacterized membrane protein YeaQ/YmgE (transglycosylase-associated protein family)